MDEALLYEINGPSAYLTINRKEKRNALTHEMIRAFQGYLDQTLGDHSVKALCITGAGERAFCSGADLGVTLSGEEKDRSQGLQDYADLLIKMAAFEKPLVARVNGPCLAGGLGLMLSCDIAIARNDAYFCTPEINVGLFPMMIGALLFRNVGRKKAMEMVLTARRVPAPEAEHMGLITRAVEPLRLDRAVHDTMEKLGHKSPTAVRFGKQAFHKMSDMPLEESVNFLCDSLRRLMRTEDAKEGLRAFMEKREPQFKGR